MNCRDIRIMMSQPTSDPASQALIADHVATCPMCADELADSVLLRLKPNSAIPPPNLTSKIMANLPATPAIARVQAEQKQQRKRIIASILLFVIVLVIGLGSYGILVNSNAPASLFGGADSAFGRGMLALTLAGKPMVASLGTLGFVSFLVLALLIVLAILTWKRLAQPTTELLTEVER